MAQIYSFRCLFTLLFCLISVFSAEYSNSFSFNKFEKDSKYLWSQFSVLGDAKVDGNGSFIQLTGLWNYSSGRIMYKKPIKLYEGNNDNKPRRRISFGTYFVFSLSTEHGDGDGDGIAFELRNGFDSRFIVEFNTKLNPVLGDLNDNHVRVRVRVRVGSHVSAGVKDTSDLKLKLNSGKKLQCWIDFDTSSKRIEVRVSKLGEKRPITPLISSPIDLSKMFPNQEVFMSLVSSNGNTTQVSKLYSWSFKLVQVPVWMHSEPLDPEGFKKDVEPVEIIHKRNDCVVRVFTALIFGTGCGILGALIALCAWSVCASTLKAAVVPEEYDAKPAVFDYDKVKVIVIDKCDSVRK